MANVAEKFGLRPYRKLDGTPLAGAQNRYTIASGYATAIFQGDLVEPKGTGNIEKHGANTSDAVVGVFNGCFYTDPTTKKPTFRDHFPASLSPGDAKAFVADDPDQLFIAQQDSVSANAVAADLNLNANLVFGAGSTTTGLSGVEIDSDSKNTTATLQVRLIDFYDVPSNDATANNSILVVKINNHQPI